MMNNLYNEEAKDKIKEIVTDVDYAMMATQLESKPSHIVPMSTKKVDEEGNIWFLSGQDSEDNTNILKDASVELIYSHPGKMTFMSLYGHAEIVVNETILKELYSDSDNNWFDGPEDPNLSAIKVKPDSAHYWEPKHNKLVTLFKIGVGAITDQKQDVGQSGELHS